MSAKKFTVGLVVGGSVLLAGCSVSPQFVNYKESNLYSSDTAGTVSYVEVGPVTAKASGFVWNSCEEVIDKALQHVEAERKKHAANATIGVQWINHAEGSIDIQPLCTTNWGWFTVFGVGGLTPWVKQAELRGKLVFAQPSDLEAMHQKANNYQATLEEQRRAKAKLEAQLKAEAAAKAAAEKQARQQEPKSTNAAEIQDPDTESSQTGATSTEQ